MMSAAEQQRPVVQQQVRRAASSLLLVHQVEIAEDPVQRERQRQSQFIGIELLNGLRADGVERVSHQGGCGDHRNHLVQQIGAVLLEDLAMARRPFGEQHQFVPPLAEREKECEQYCEDQ